MSEDWKASINARLPIKPNSTTAEFVPKVPNPFFKEVNVDGKVLVGF